MNEKPNADSQSSASSTPAVPEIKTPDQDKTKAGTKPQKDGTLHIEIKKLNNKQTHSALYLS